eukprot:PITA_29843
MQEVSTVGDVEHTMPRINVSLDDHQAEYQPTMIKCEGMVVDQLVSLLFNPGASLSYISPKVVEKCQLQSSKFNKPWLVQLATGKKRRVSAKTKHFPITVSGQSIHVDLNALPFGSYDVLIGMEGLEGHWSLFNCTEKYIYVVQVGYTNSKSKMTSLENIPAIHNFIDVFPESIPRLPPKCDTNFTIELIPGEALVLRAPYRMSIHELPELKMQLRELLDKGYVRPSVSPWEVPMLFM